MNSRLTIAAHILGMLAWNARECHASLTSDELAASIGTNPVVVRRVLAQLNAAGLVESRRGASGGSVLARDPRSINLRQAYEAVEGHAEPLLGRYANAVSNHCSIAPVIEAYLDEVLSDAEEQLKQRLAMVDVETMSYTIAARLQGQYVAPMQDEHK